MSRYQEITDVDEATDYRMAGLLWYFSETAKVWRKVGPWSGDRTINYNNQLDNMVPGPWQGRYAILVED